MVQSMFSKRFVIGALALLTPLAVLAEEGNQTTPNLSAPNAPQSGELETTAPAPGGGKFYGLAELRPSFTTAAGEWHTENTLEAGWQFNKNVRVTYLQWFNTNLAPVRGSSDDGKGMNIVPQDGIFRIKANNLWTSEDKTASFNFQGRAYTPTYAPKRDAGFITTLRSYFTFKKTVANGLVDLIASETPTFHAFTRAGYNNTANPLFENMVIAEVDLHLTKTLTFSFPFILQNIRHRAFQAGAKFNDRWETFAYIWPELDWEVSDHHTLGVAFYSDNLFKDDFSGLTVGTGLEKGVVQFVWTATL